MHNEYMQVVRNRMYLERIPRRDRMYLACCMLHDSRRDHGMKARSQILLGTRSWI